ncbi:hypothetical protein RN001_013144 [Aquatica leii]|uniref:Cytochrome b5 heme-binding domain-containing protein n=1 Tax=Aquatica leii TaxID=1421715 RepID=A0AAN7PQ81_9COLE|nr:hypothetical protein RN001_013144 [Aquatica leii]
MSNKSYRSNNKWVNYIMDKFTYKWLENKKYVDDLNGLWRVHDGLYDVTDFIDSHPGGKFWLKETKGMDITEAFETHHIKSDIPELLLKKFFIKNATNLRMSKFKFDEDGFYKTLKRKVRVALKTLPKDCHKISNMYTDLLLLATFVLACIANACSMFTFMILASISCSFLLVATHNYIHQRDNLRMYYGTFFMFSASVYRIAHVLSHHAFPNSHFDLQLIIGLPLVNVFPEKKSFAVKYLPLLSSYAFIFPITLHAIGLINIVESFILKKNYVNLILPLALPILMYYTGNNTLISTFGTWQIMLLLSSSIYATIAFTTTHVHPNLYIEGDAMRSNDELDWGISQLDTSYDKKEVIGSHFFGLITFGDHALHHLFPTLDHGYLKHLYPIFESTLKEFNIRGVNVTTSVDLYLGYFKQAIRDVPKLKPPSSKSCI